MAAKPPDDEKPLDAMTGDELRAHALRHGFVLDDTLANADIFPPKRGHEYPREDVEASRKNRRLQGKHPVTEAKVRYLREAKSCPKCDAPAEALSWFYFRSPKETWAMECGVEGWMAVCDRCYLQVNFFIQAIS